MILARALSYGSPQKPVKLGHYDFTLLELLPRLSSHRNGHNQGTAKIELCVTFRKTGVVQYSGCSKLKTAALSTFADNIPHMFPCTHVSLFLRILPKEK